GDEKSDSYQVFPDYSQLVPDRTTELELAALKLARDLTPTPISHIMSSKVRRFHLMNHGRSPRPSLACRTGLFSPKRLDVKGL
ncbi:hypothetical protein, partial [Mycolicibacterium sp. GF69]|uniref:hypothetical protein n=1 Tax=Mycolicibacterium sp. GF69 TaxID=2267251 RepID=UPI00197C75D2